MSTGSRTLCAGVAAALMLAVAPWGAAAADAQPATGTVSGIVTFRGKPLPGGTVGFHPAKGKPVVARIQADGSYSAPAVPVGAVKLTVETASLKPKGGGLPGGKPAQYVAIPEQYASPATSPLRYTVVKGVQSLKIKLK